MPSKDRLTTAVTLSMPAGPNYRFDAYVRTSLERDLRDLASSATCRIRSAACARSRSGTTRALIGRGAGAYAGPGRSGPLWRRGGSLAAAGARRRHDFFHGFRQHRGHGTDRRSDRAERARHDTPPPRACLTLTGRGKNRAVAPRRPTFGEGTMRAANSPAGLFESTRAVRQIADQCLDRQADGRRLGEVFP